MINIQENVAVKLIKDAARKHGFSDQIKLSFPCGNENGNGFMGEIKMVDIEDEATGNKLNLVLKVSINDEKVKRILPMKESYMNEIHAYQKVFPAFEELQTDFKISEKFNSIAKFYAGAATLNYDYLILENLKKNRYELINLKETLDPEHMTFIFKKFGHLHGLSFAMKHIRPEMFKSLDNGLRIWKLLMEKEGGMKMHQMFKSVQEMVKEKGFESQKLNIYAKNFVSIMKQVLNDVDEKYCCFIHGDCWPNNLLFKYEICDGRKQLEDIKLLDWQACTIGSPIWDLSNCLYSGASKEVLDDFENYLKIYHESLSNVLAQFKLDVNSVYPYDELKKQWRKHYHFGALLGTTDWKVRSMDGKDALDPLNYKPDDGSTYFDGMAHGDCDRNYLYKYIKILYEHLDKIANLDW